MQTGSWGYTWRDGCRCSQESGLSHGFVRTDLQAAVHLCLASWAGLYTLCLLSLWQQGSRTAAYPLHSGPFSSQNPNRKHWICLSSLCMPLWHSLQSQTIPHALTLDILDTELKLTVHKLEFKNCLPIYLPINYLSICLSVYLSVYPSSICLSILVKNIY